MTPYPCLNRYLRPVGLVALVAASTLLATVASASSWPQFRGPNSDGTWRGTTAFSTDPEFHLVQRWQVPIGSGYSGVAIADGKAFTLFSDGTNDVAAAFDTKTGKELWRYTIEETYKGHDGSHDGPISTPAIANGTFFGLSASGRFVAVDADNGHEKWSVDLKKEFTSKPPYYGYATSPTVVDGVVVLEVGGEKSAVAGFDPLTGKRLWSFGEDGVSYQSPTVVDMQGVGSAVIAATDKTLIAITPRNGHELWSYEHGGEGAQGSATMTPVAAGGHRFFLASKDNESTVVELTPGDGKVESKTLWSNRSIRKSYTVPVYYDGHIYGVSTRFLTCVDAETGKADWRSRQPGDGFLALVDGHLVITTKEGGLYIARATPKGYEERAGMSIGNDLIWAPPAFDGRSIYVRSLGALTRVDVRPGPAGGLHIDQDQTADTKFGRFLKGLAAATDKKAVVDSFMASQKSFPIIEGKDTVHFVYRGHVDDVAVAGDFIGARQERDMTHVPGTDFFYYTAKLEPDARTNYMYFVDYKHTLDPLNPRKTTTNIFKDEMEMNFGDEPLEMSWVAMPEWRVPTHLNDVEKGPKGRLNPFELDSKLLGDKVEVSVYLPAGYNSGSKRYPVVYVHGGKKARERGHWVTTLDNEVGKSITPLIVVFFDANARGKEAQYGQMFASELIPEVDKKYRTLADADHRAVAGTGFAAFSALGSALGNPGLIGKLGMQSLFMFGSMRQGVEPLFKTADEQPLVIYQDWGKYDLRNSHEAWDLARTNRDFNKELRDRGYRPLGGEVHDGTGWSSWRNRTDLMLAALFPNE